MSLRLQGSLFYLLYYLAVGGLLPYLNLYYQSIGIATVNIGVLATLMLLATLIASPVWSGLADALRIHRRLMILVPLMTLLPAALMAGTHDFVSLAILVTIVGACLAPVLPLADSAVISGLGARRNEYGRIRLWGAIGYGAGAWAVGGLAHLAGMPVIFFAFVLLMLPAVLIASRFPAPTGTITEPYWRSLRQLLTRPGWLRFLFSMLLFGMCSSIIQNYYPLYLKNLSGDETLIGPATAVASVGEVLIFALASRMLRRFSAARLIQIAFVAMAIRCGFYALIQNPVLAVVINLSHGFTFSAMWTAGVLYANQIAPVGIGTSAQSIFSATAFGLAGIASALPGSLIYASAGPAALFAIGSLVAVVGLIIFSTGAPEGKPKRMVEEA
jgi:PPP family 3-phenylpropionic acid transporter